MKNLRLFMLNTLVLAVGAFIMYGSFIPNARALVINEIMYNLSGNDEDREWVELYNDELEAVTVATGSAGWRFFDGSNHLINNPIQGSAVLRAGEFAILADDAVTFLGEHPDFSGTVFDTVMSLNNTTDTLRILDEGGVVRDEVTYTNQWGADGDGNSLERVSVILWDQSLVAGGTPGEENSALASPTSSPPPAENTQTPAPTPSSTPAYSPTPTPDSTSSPQATPLPLPTASPVPTTMPEPTQTPQISPDSTPSPAFPTLTPVPSDEPDEQESTPQSTDGAAGQAPDPLPTEILPAPSATQIPEPAILPKVHINEFFPNTPGKDSDEEWVEIWNSGTIWADISGWKLDDGEGGSSPFIIPQGTLVAPDGYLVFPRPKTGIALNNDKDAVRLITPGGQLYENITYEKPPRGASSNRTMRGTFVWSWIPTPGWINVIGSEQDDGQKQEAITSPLSKSPNPVSISLSPDLIPKEESVETKTQKTKYNLTQGNKQAVTNNDSVQSEEDDNNLEQATSNIFFTANIIEAVPEAHRSFFSRHALALVSICAFAGSLALILWKRQYTQANKAEKT